MLKPLNGWYRIGIALSAIWVLGVTAVVCYQFFFVFHVHYDRLFVTQDIPIGTGITDKVIDEMQWGEYRHAPKLRTLRWVPICSMLTLPLLGGWVFSIASVKTVKWIRAGFQSSDSQSSPPPRGGDTVGVDISQELP